MMLILLFAIDAGRLFLGWVNLQNMARIASNYAANYPTASFGPGSAYETQIQADATTINCTLKSPHLPTFPDVTKNIGDRAQVSMSCDFPLLTPFLSLIIKNPVTLSASSVFPIRGGIIGGVPVSGTLPTPTPSASPSPSASPTPGPSASAPPTNCTVPFFIGSNADNAQTAWNTAGFVPSNLTVSLGPTGYTITKETPANKDGTSQTCSKFGMTVQP
jgi:hypothetical protein